MKLESLISALKELELPTEPIQLTKQETITNPKRFVEISIEILRSNPGKRIYLPYYTRLLKFYELCKPSTTP